MRVDQKINDPEIQEILGWNDQPHRETAAVQAVLTRRLVDALNAHGSALASAAKASDKYAKWIAFATGALVLATLALVWATLKIGG